MRYLPESGELFWKPRGIATWDSGFSGKPALNHKDTTGYLRGTLLGKRVLAHRICFAIHNGYLPSNIDHINGIRDDNRASNLREATMKQNSQNRTGLNKTSNYKGVCWNTNSGRWRVTIWDGTKQLHVGMFDDEIDAAKAYDKICESLYGDFSRLNFKE